MPTTFAGFTYPKRTAIYRNAARWQSENLAAAGGKDATTKSGKRRKTRWCFVYYAVAPAPLPRTPNDNFASFYHGSDFMPGLRWQWANDVCRSVSYAGHSTGDYGSDTIHGIVFRLPRGRGFLAGWSMGEGMCGAVHCHVIADEDEAARTADDMAAVAAENEREHAAREAEELEGED